MTAPTLAVVIATFDRYPVLADTLADLHAQDAPAEEVVVVDATPAAHHAVPAWVGDPAFGRVRYVRSEGVGANRTRNVGLRLVTADYVLLLDDDMRLPPGCLAGFRAAHAQGWDAVHGQLTQHGEALAAGHGGDRPFWNLLRHRHGARRCHTIAVSSSFVSVRTALLRELGWLDERFLYAYDDYDLGYRLWQAGCITLHEPTITGVHLQAPAGGGRHAASRAARGRNAYVDKYRFLSKHFSRRALVVEALTDALFVTRRWLGEPSRPHWRGLADVVRAYRRVAP